MVSLRFILTLFFSFLFFAPGILFFFYFKPELFFQLDVARLGILAGVYGALAAAPLATIMSIVFYLDSSPHRQKLEGHDSKINASKATIARKLKRLREDKGQLEAMAVLSKSQERDLARLKDLIDELEELDDENNSLAVIVQEASQKLKPSGFTTIAIPAGIGIATVNTTLLIYIQYILKEKDVRFFVATLVLIMATQIAVWAWEAKSIARRERSIFSIIIIAIGLGLMIINAIKN